MMQFLSGKKTYIVSVGMVLYAVGGFVSGNMDPNEAFRTLLEGLGLAGVRAAIGKVSQ